MLSVDEQNIGLVAARLEVLMCMPVVYIGLTLWATL